jgi:anti-anti-sigma factor
MSEKAGGVVKTVTTPTRFDGSTAPAIESVLQQLMTGGEVRVACDLAATDYVSSAALRVLLAGAKGLRAAGGELVLCCARPYVREILETAGFDKMMRVFDTIDAARAALGA